MLPRFPCPNAEAIAPCFCSRLPAGITLDCTNVTSEAQLQEVFTQNFPVKNFFEFKMDHSKSLISLNVSTNGVSFESISLFPGPFSSLSEVTEEFLGASRDTLSTLTIWRSDLSDDNFPFESLEDFSKLYSLNLVAAEFEYFPPLNSSTLGYLDLSSAHIQEIPEGTV